MALYNLITFIVLLSISNICFGTDNKDQFLVTIDTTMAEQVIEGLKGKPIDQEKLKNHLGLKALLTEHKRSFNGTITSDRFFQLLSQCSNSPKNCQDEGAFKFKDAQQNIKKLEFFLNKLKANQAKIEQDIQHKLLKHIPPAKFAFKHPIYIILGGKMDAYVSLTDSAPLMIIELNTMNGHENIDESWNYFHAALDHEVWHGLFLKYVELNWKSINPYALDNVEYHMFFAMLNEGYGHYLSMLAFNGGDNKKTLANILKKTETKNKDGFYDLFIKNMDLVRSDKIKNKQEFVMSGWIGPMFQKWIAMTGALYIAQLTEKLGQEQVVALMSKNPYQIWLTYKETFKDSKMLPPKIFWKILEDVQKLENEGKLK